MALVLVLTRAVAIVAVAGFALLLRRLARRKPGGDDRSRLQVDLDGKPPRDPMVEVDGAIQRETMRGWGG